VSPALAERLFGPVLKTSVSRLEQFAACPFRFFVHSGLRAEERKMFELDFREQGSFQHDVLQRFHEELQAAQKHWRDVTPAEARERIGHIAGELMTHYRDGLLRDSAQTRFTAGVLTRALQDFIEVIVGWMHTRYRFDPVAVEVDFAEAGRIPAWKLDLGAGRQLLLRGRIDRVDLFREPGADTAWCVVMDYKSSAKKLDPLLVQHGVQLQLLSYLNVLRHAPDARWLGVSRIMPVGAFFVNLRGKHNSGDSRAVLGNADAARKEAYRHTGRFDLSALPALDASGDTRGEQFNYRLRKDGTPYTNSSEPLTTEAFQALLDQVEIQLRDMGRRIFDGEAKVDPYRKGTETPCKYCDYAHVCRIDPWTHEYRVLRREGAEAAQPEGE
jgi:ATP-dependent helicase/nuclease subunit B